MKGYVMAEMGSRDGSPSALTQLRNNWPLIAACVVGAIGYGEMRLEVRQLVDDKADEKLQWSRITNNSTSIARLENKTQNISSQSWEEWGQVKQSVRQHNILLPLIDDRLDELERQTHGHRSPDFQ